MKYTTTKNLFLLVLCTFLSNISWAQNITCFMPTPNNPPVNFAPQNNAICNDFLNYVPDEDNYSHTPTKIIKVNIHYFLTNEPLNPRNLTETTGFSLTDSWNTGYQFAKDLIEKCNLLANQNAPSLIPPSNGYPNHPIKIKYEIYKDPNDPNDKGVYYHRFADWWDNVNNAPNLSSDYWYSHMKGGILSPIYLKNKYAIHGPEVIDIFFQDNWQLNDLGGMASGWGMATDAAYCGSDMYEGWNNGLQWTDNWAGTMFHEVGHLLNLYHSWESDGCSDTYQSGVTCYQWPGTGGTLYDNNYMSYCPKPMSAFTPEQLGRINYFLESNNPRYVRDEVICRTDDQQDITILSGENITWNSTKHLKGSLIIEPNATLTIKCDVFLKELAYIKVMEKGHLIIDGGRVTSECDSKLWYGIFVLGDESKNQTTIEQGKVETKNDAVVEDAIIGIRTGNFYYNQNDLSYPAFSGKTGGIIQSKNTLFRNNRKSVEFMKYHNILPPPYNIEVDNVSYFTDCSFINDDYLKGYDYNIPNQWGPEFITAWDVQGVKFTNCLFKENVTDNFQPDLTLKTTAIGSFGAKYQVYNCKFENLYAGIWAESALDPMDFLDIKNSTLDNVHINLTSINQYGDQIAGNTIKNQPASNYWNLTNNLIYSWGIYTKGSTQFKIHDNYISSANPIGSISMTPVGLLYQMENNIGLVNSETWFENCIVAENRIENQSVAVQTEDRNYNLNFTCNEHKGNQLNWYVNPASTWGYLNDQGTATGENRNQFHDGCYNPGTKNQIRSELSIPFLYFDDVNNASKPDPLCVTPNVNLSFAIPPGPPQSCNQYKPILGPSGNGTITIDNVNLSNLNGYQKQTLLLELAAYHSELGEISKVIKSLEMLNSIEAAKLLVSLYYSINDNKKATEWLNKLTKSDLLIRDELNPSLNVEYPSDAFDQDKTDFVTLFQTLIQNQTDGRTIYNLTDAELTSIYSLSENDSRSGFMAKGLLSFINKNVRSMNPEIPTNNIRRETNEMSSSSFSQFTVFPNPSSNEITLKRNSAFPATFIIHDIIGNKIAEFKLNENEYEKTFSTNNLNMGSYFGTLYSGDKQNQTIKIIKVK